MINKENIRRWVARLRDPETKQARDVLRTPDGAMCCLGVAIDIIAPDSWEDVTSTDTGKPAVHSLFACYKFGDDPVMPDFTFMRNHFGFENPENYEGYASMNDAGRSFAEIANEIEEDYLSDGK